MKNYTLRSLYLTMMVLLALASKNATAQCVAPTAGATMTPTSTYQQILTQSGRYYSFTANAGCKYTFTHCQGGGNAPIGTDPLLTLTDASNNIITFNNDAGGICGGSAGSEIIWTCPASGTYRIHHCASSAQSATMGFKVECPCVSGTSFASPNVVCFGQTTTLTLTGRSPGSLFQWQSSTDNINFVNVGPPQTTPYTTGPLSVNTWFRAIVNCDGVTGNTVGADTTASVQVQVNVLPVINFPSPTGSICCNSAPITLTATPAGGTFSAMNGSVTGNIFTPRLACGTTTAVTYSVTDGNNCTNQVVHNVVVNDTPAVTWAPITQAYCITNCTSMPIPAATPAGGTYDDFIPGAFVSGTTFNPCNAGGSGAIPIRYTISNTTTGCTSVKLNSITINPQPNVTLPDIPDMCVGSGCQQFNGAPSGGVYSDTWNNVNASTGQWCPTTAGLNSVRYIYTDGNGCADTGNVDVIANAYPTIQWQLAFPTLCVNGAALNLNGYATPGGGTWGNGLGNSGVTGSTFNPALVTPGTYWITYTVTNNGCTKVDSQQITVIAAPVVNFVNGPVPPVCINSAPFSLTNYTTPTGGTWAITPNVGSSINATTGVFTPSGAGVYTVTYTYVQGSCQNTVTFQVTVNALPNVNLPATLPSICENAVEMLLNQGTPAGGTYTGIGVTTPPAPQYFNPQGLANSGLTITYTFTDANNCTNFDTAHIFVKAPPAINFPPIPDVCDEAAAFQLQAVPAGSGGVFYDFDHPGDVTGTNPYYFNPGNAIVGNHTITYIYNDVASACADTATQNVIVKPLPTGVSISSFVNPTACNLANGSFCISGLLPNTNYLLDYYRNGTYQGPFPILSNNAGQYCRMNLIGGIYDQIYVYLNGCGQLVPLSVTLTDPAAPAPPTATSNSPVCQYGTITLNASSPVANGAYSWTGPVSFGANTAIALRPNAQPTHSGVYSVTVTNPVNNCTSLPGTVNVVVNAAPTLTVSSNSPVCQGNTLNLNASSTTPNTSFFWTGPITSAQANPTVPNVTAANAGWYKVTVTNNTTGCTRTDSVLVVVGTVIPVASIANGNTPICSGQALNLTATNSTPGASYLWNGPAFTSNIQNPTKPNMQLSDEGLYYVKATLNGCESDTNSVYIEVIQSLSPTITITANPNDTVCFGTNIDFTSVITDGGSSPQYQWYINGVPVIGAIDSFWGSPYLTDLDTITAVLTNSTTCTVAASATSNKITIHMSPNTVPTVFISSNPIVWVAGQPMVFTANALNAGGNPTYQWFLNGAILPGETAVTFNSSTLTEQDILSVVVNSDAPCAIPDTAADDWNAITNLSVNKAGNGIEDMKLFPNPNDGTFMLMGTFTGMTGVKSANLEIVNAVGQVVYSEKASIHNGKLDKQIKTTDISSGVYMLRISAENYSTQMKFVVNK